jgi:hypothetical protein
MSDADIYIIDQITPRAGKAESFFKIYMDEYAPRARSRGLQLEHSWINPPVWLDDDQSNTLIFVWSLTGGVGNIWRVMAVPEALDGSGGFWWRDVGHMITKRSRSMYSDVASIADLTNV